MPDKILLAQFLTLFLTALLYAAAFILGLHHMRKPTNEKSPPPQATTAIGFQAKAIVFLATTIGAALLAWRAAAEGKITLPLHNHFDAFLALAILLALVLMYFRWTRHLSSLSFFMLPMIAGLLLLGGILQIASPQNYPYENIWTKIHIATVVTGAACFALACVGAIVYLLTDRQLKRKTTPATSMGPRGGGGGGEPSRLRFPPLASTEKFNQWMVYLGFPLLTLAMITGILRLSQSETPNPSTLHMSPKLSFAMMTWLIYAVLLHLPLAPSFRGQRAAWLSIIGFILFLAGYIAANWMK
jgi:ABC-type transport system involved in cytochrome c biogenesis permease subunit